MTLYTFVIILIRKLYDNIMTVYTFVLGRKYMIIRELMHDTFTTSQVQ